jgi:Papain family cysteine protease
MHETALFPAATSFLKYNVLVTRSRQPPKSSLFMPGSKAKYVDLRPTLPPVYEPIRWISCSASMALCAGYEHAVASPHEQFRASPLFLYLHERYVDRRPPAFTMENAAMSMERIGVCSDAVFGFQAAGVGSAVVRDADLKLPGPDAYESASAHPVELHRIKVDCKDMIRCLQSGFVIVTAVKVFSSFHDCPSDGFVNMPEKGELPFDRENEGGQGIVIVGFDEECDDGVWIVRNSRGKAWGLDGHAYLPFGYEDYFADLYVVSYPA